MNVVIIGGVAAGTKAAAKLKRMDQTIRITLLSQHSGKIYCPDRRHRTYRTGGLPAGQCTAADFRQKSGKRRRRGLSL